MKPKVWPLVIVLLLGAPLAGITWSVLDTEPVAAVDMPAWQWNIFGSCTTSPRPGNCGSTRLIPGKKPEEIIHISVAASSNRPWTIALNEVCGRQRTELINRLAPYGYTLRFAKADGTPGAPGTSTPAGVPFGTVNCGASHPTAAEAVFGNALLVLGSVNAWSFPADNYYQNSTRNYSCIVAGTFSGNRMSCVTHLDTNPTTSLNQDGASLLYSINYMNNMGHNLIIGADRNRTDHLNWPTYFDEFDTRPTKMKTHPSNAPDKKRDWIYAGPKPNHTPLAGSSRYCAGGIPTGATGWISDHCMIFGIYRI